jgi:hypothetical protein
MTSASVEQPERASIADLGTLATMLADAFASDPMIM